MPRAIEGEHEDDPDDHGGDCDLGRQRGGLAVPASDALLALMELQGRGYALLSY